MNIHTSPQDFNTPDYGCGIIVFPDPNYTEFWLKELDGTCALRPITDIPSSECPYVAVEMMIRSGVITYIGNRCFAPVFILAAFNGGE